MISAAGRHKRATMYLPAYRTAAALLVLALGACGKTGGGAADGGAGSSGGAGSAGGATGGTGMGGATGGGGAAGGDPFAECMRPQQASRVPPNFVVALDTSRAMNDAACTDCGAPATRWATAVDGINAAIQGTQADVRWGLSLVGDGASACGLPDDVDVGAALGTASAIEAALGARTAGGRLINPGERPIRGAAAAAAEHLARLGIHLTSFVVLVTAGTPTCAVGADDPTGDDTPAAVEALRSAFLTEGIRTVVVGVGSLDAAVDASLQEMASAGSLRLTDPIPSYFRAGSTAEVQTVLQSLVQATEGCTFEVPPPPNALAEQSSFVVMLGGVQIPRSNLNGWEYRDLHGPTIQLTGTACEAARMTHDELPTILFLCPLI